MSSRNPEVPEPQRRATPDSECLLEDGGDMSMGVGRGEERDEGWRVGKEEGGERRRKRKRKQQTSTEKADCGEETRSCLSCLFGSRGRQADREER